MRDTPRDDDQDIAEPKDSDYRHGKPTDDEGPQDRIEDVDQ